MQAASRWAPGGVDHLSVIALTAAGAVAVVWWARRVRKPHPAAERLVAAVLLANEGASWIVALLRYTVRVPLQLCDLAVLLMAWALWRPRSPAVSEVAYYWAMAGSLQALLTPDLQRGFPDYWWVKFFVTHCGVVWSAVYLAASGRLALTHGSVWRIWGLTNLYAAAAGLINWGWGTNYGYLARKPSQPSLLDYFGPWPQYIIVLEVAALASFYLYYGLSRVIRPAQGVEG